MKKRGGGKAKGSAFERWVAKELSKWLTGGKDPKQLIRSVLSGGWQGARVQDGWRQAGDLAPNGPEGERFRSQYAVECKHHKSIDLYGLWTREGDIKQWWGKLSQEAQTAGVQPLLVFRANQRPTMVAMPSALFAHVRMTAYLGAPMGHPTWPGAEFYAHGFVIVPFEHLLRLPPAVLLSYRSAPLVTVKARRPRRAAELSSQPKE